MQTATYCDISASIEQAQRGDTAAFAGIVRRYQSLVCGVLFSATGDFHKSEDLAQETFLIAWNKLGELKNTADIAPWLCTIARNLAHRSFRKKQVTANSPAESLPNTQVSPEPGPVSEALRREQSELVWSAIAKIPEPYRETLVLYYRSGQSIAEIAAATASSDEAIRQRLVRARKSLKVKLETLIGDILTDSAPGDFFTMSVVSAIGVTMLSTTSGCGTITASVTGTTAATGGKALGSASIWSVLGPMVYFGWIGTMFFGGFWTSVRNAPTLRSRRCQVNYFFWLFQYFWLSIVMLIWGGNGVFLVLDYLAPRGSMPIYVFAIPVIAPLFLGIFLVRFLQNRKIKRIVENDLGLPGPREESYTWPQVEQRFFSSLITNTLLALTILAFFIIVSIHDGMEIFVYRSYGYNIFAFSFSWTLAIIAIAAVSTAIYYPLGRYFLEICRTKQTFLAAPPIFDNPFEPLFKDNDITSYAMYSRKNKNITYSATFWGGLAVLHIFVLSFYSWDKHPIPLGICTALLVALNWGYAVLHKRAKNQSNIALLNALYMLCLPVPFLILEYIEFGGIYCFYFFGKTNISPIHGWTLGFIALSIVYTPCALFQWSKAKREESDDKIMLLQEAIARFDPVTMIADKP